MALEPALQTGLEPGAGRVVITCKCVSDSAHTHACLHTYTHGCTHIYTTHTHTRTHIYTHAHESGSPRLNPAHLLLILGEVHRDGSWDCWDSFHLFCLVIKSDCVSHLKPPHAHTHTLPPSSTNTPKNLLTILMMKSHLTLDACGASTVSTLCWFFPYVLYNCCNKMAPSRIHESLMCLNIKLLISHYFLIH